MITLHAYLTMKNPQFLKFFIDKYPPEHENPFIWSLPWAEAHLDWAVVEKILHILPITDYHLLSYTDAFDEAFEHGTYNIHNVKLERTVSFATTLGLRFWQWQ